MTDNKKLSQKLRLLYLDKILYEETDDMHSLTRSQINGRISDFGLEIPDRDTFADDIKQLKAFGRDIISEKIGRENYYHVGEREFELPELKLVVDSVQSSRFLSENRSRKLIEKLERYVSRYEAEQLNRQVYVKDRIKNENAKSYYAVDIVNEAISKGKKICFKYIDYVAERVLGENGSVSVKKVKKFRHEQKEYVVSPWNMISNNQNYYMVGFEAGKGIKHFRLDRMVDAALLEESIEKEVFKGMKISDYAEKRFDMFDGEEEDVVLQFKDKLFAVLDDRFGRKIVVRTVNEEYLETTVRVCVSNQFLCWILSLGNDIQIAGPEKIRNEAKMLLAQRSELYK